MSVPVNFGENRTTPCMLSARPQCKKWIKMLIKRVQRGNGARARAEILRGVAGKVNECACEF